MHSDDFPVPFPMYPDRYSTYYQRIELISGHVIGETDKEYLDNP